MCIGCGGEIERDCDRTNLRSASSIHVVPLWKEIVGGTLQEEADLDKILNESEYTGRMHRKCFALFEKAIRVRSEFEEKIKKRISVIVLVANRGSSTSTIRDKRPVGSDMAIPIPKKKQARFTLTTPVNTVLSSSPDVSVTISIDSEYRNSSAFCILSGSSGLQKSTYIQFDTKSKAFGQGCSKREQVCNC